MRKNGDLGRFLWFIMTNYYLLWFFYSEDFDGFGLDGVSVFFLVGCFLF